MQRSQEKRKQSEGTNEEKLTVDNVGKKGRGDWLEDKGIT